MPFENRWRLTGRLTTTTPLHVGNGETATHPDLIDERQKRPIDIAAVATDYQGQAYIPGKTLKGNLRAWLHKHHVAPALVDGLFGSDDPGAANAVGGKAEFWDAFVVPLSQPPSHVPYWHSHRLTGVSASVAIDRVTRTAQPNKLFHYEYVPPGVSFEVTVSAQDIESEELHLLLYVLEQFQHANDPVVVGAETGDGQGRFMWDLHDVACLNKQDVIAWLQSPNAPVGYDGYRLLDATARAALVTQAQQTFQATMHPSLSLDLTICVDGPFLVNDPSQTKRTKHESQDEDALPDHAPRRNHHGAVLLPASSLRGAFRSQAEKIVRTLRPDAACCATHPHDACTPIYDSEERATHLCLTCQVFGAPGWRAPVAFSDFALAPGHRETPFHQEFLAIDRFTGGGAPGLKFDANAAYQPILSGTMTVDLHRLDTWAIGLLALTLRDLLEGDIPLGFGASKGYGACRATITDVRVDGVNPRSPLWAVVEAADATHIDLNQLDLTVYPPPDEVQLMLMGTIEAFHEQVNSFVRATAPQGATHDVS